ncbi:4206_t:CDS:2 [Dentiscutata heterogama]|uniref:4206_t:CDS:1 n=1 Tax=Dentiscutata heterogama TaxID=1316150 RepID=A0ACA9K9W2_9GLOM|nr:4206_t:CDS:2 [Dentiscutata heterogama]
MAIRDRKNTEGCFKAIKNPKDFADKWWNNCVVKYYNMICRISIELFRATFFFLSVGITSFSIVIFWYIRIVFSVNNADTTTRMSKIFIGIDKSKTPKEVKGTSEKIEFRGYFYFICDELTRFYDSIRGNKLMRQYIGIKFEDN